MALSALFGIAIAGNLAAIVGAARAMYWYEARTGQPGVGWWAGALAFALGVAATIGLLAVLVVRSGRGVG